MAYTKFHETISLRHTIRINITRWVTSREKITRLLQRETRFNHVSGAITVTVLVGNPYWWATTRIRLENVQLTQRKCDHYTYVTFKVT